MGLKIVTKRGTETIQLREQFGLTKLKNKSKQMFETHCVDAWVLAASETGASYPTTNSLLPHSIEVAQETAAQARV